MGRFGKYFTDDEQEAEEGDKGFVGLNMKLDRGLLDPGICARLVNKRLTKGEAEPRGGIVTPKFANIVSYGTIYGSGIYSDPDDVEWMLIAVPGGVYRCRHGHYPDLIRMPIGETLGVEVDLVQCFDRVLMFRGEALRPLEWTGVFGERFAAINPSPTGSGAEEIPNAVTAELVGPRLFVPHDRNKLSRSDILDYTHYDPVVGDFNLTSGTSEVVVRVFPWYSTSMLIYKSSSMGRLRNVSGGAMTDVRLDTVTPEIGLWARRSVAVVGGDAFHLALGGVWRTTQLDQDRTQVAQVPVSDPIEPIIARINWPAAVRSVGTTYGEYYYLAVPLDSSTVSNAILCYHIPTGQWHGHDEAAFEGFGVSNLIKTDYPGGKKRLFAVDNQGKRVMLLEEGPEDIVGGVVYPINDIVESRGYAFNAPIARKKSTRISMAIATWNPKFSVTAITEGVKEDAVLATNVTRDRSKYWTHGSQDYDVTNVNGDQLAPQRQDYSVTPGAGVQLKDGLQLSLRQERIERYSVKKTGRWVSFRVSGTQGGASVQAIGTDAIEKQRTIRGVS